MHFCGPPLRSILRAARFAIRTSAALLLATAGAVASFVQIFFAVLCAGHEVDRREIIIFAAGAGEEGELVATAAGNHSRDKVGQESEEEKEEDEACRRGGGWRR